MNNQLTFRFLAEPTDVNFGGKVHGGAVMKWIDQASYACAVGWSDAYCVTVYVGGIRFFKSIQIGNMVEVRTRIMHTGRTSIHIAVEVWSKPIHEEELVKNTHCIIVFVAMDDKGKPKEVPAWKPVTQDDRDLEMYAKKLMDLRTAIEDEMKKFPSLS
ncbi:MAG: acyl-CoA thioesterase [Flavobacteriales bacterium]